MSKFSSITKSDFHIKCKQPSSRQVWQNQGPWLFMVDTDLISRGTTVLWTLQITSTCSLDNCIKSDVVKLESVQRFEDVARSRGPKL